MSAQHETTKTVFVLVQEMDADYGGGASTEGVYSSEEKALQRQKELENERDASPRRYKYPTIWFVEEHELDQ